MKPKANTAPTRRPTLGFKLDSNLVKPEHIPIFSSWIDKKDSSHYNKKKNPYKFNLLYRASRDGNTAAAFHEKCDNKGATIVIAKVQNSEKIVGGYNLLFGIKVIVISLQMIVSSSHLLIEIIFKV